MTFASSSRQPLGRGLSTLLGPEVAVSPSKESGSDQGIMHIQVTDVMPSPYQPRQVFRPEELDELAASIRQKGVLQPVLVRATNTGEIPYEIIAGERRWRAATKAGLRTVPAIVMKCTPQEASEFALIENIHRADLSPLEEAQGYFNLISSYNYTQEELSQVLGKSRSYIANTLRLLNLPESIKAHLKSGAISAGHARALLTADDPEALCQEILQQGLNVRQVEERTKARRQSSSATPSRPALYSEVADLEEQLSKTLGTKVTIKVTGEKGEIRIQFSSFNQLDELMNSLVPTAV